MSTNEFNTDEPRSASSASADTTSTEANDQQPSEQLELTAQIELLEDENRRLREEYVRARQSQYRSTAIGLAVIGVGAVLGGLLIPNVREILIALGATGLFGALLTYYLTPNQFVAADVGERVYTAVGTNLKAIADELGLQDERVYIPVETAPARLYVPQHADYSIPDDRAGPIVVDDDARGLFIEATGTELFREFTQALTGELATEPTMLASQLTDGLVEQFELVRSVDTDIDAANGRATIAITDSAFGTVDRFDHPIPSFLAVGFATGLDQQISLEVAEGGERADWLITCRWNVDPEAGSERDQSESE